MFFPHLPNNLLQSLNLNLNQLSKRSQNPKLQLVPCQVMRTAKSLSSQHQIPFQLNLRRRNPNTEDQSRLDLPHQMLELNQLPKNQNRVKKSQLVNPQLPLRNLKSLKDLMKLKEREPMKFNKRKLRRKKRKKRKKKKRRKRRKKRKKRKKRKMYSIVKNLNPTQRRNQNPRNLNKQREIMLCTRTSRKT